MTRSLEYVRYSMIGPVLDGCTYLTYAPKSLDSPTSTVLLELAVVGGTHPCSPLASAASPSVCDPAF